MAACRTSLSTAAAEVISFTDLGVPAALTRVLAAQGISTPSPIQAATLPDALAGRDVLGRGRTGSGKTFAFVLPVLAKLAASGLPARPSRPRALILVPTRELAVQVDHAMTALAEALSLRTLTVFGGVRPGPQITKLRAGVDVLVACPGRLVDHLEHYRAHLDAVEITVLDEADHMADLGFLPSVRQILDRTPRDAQRLLFSATLDSGVHALTTRYLTDPVTHSVDSDLSPVTSMSHHVLHVRPEDRVSVLAALAAAPGRTLVFTRTKRGATLLARRLVAAGVAAIELHGDLAQSTRSRHLAAFAEGTATTLVATDIAARGIHVDDVALVVHADPPFEHKAYLHRSGRTARAGATGTVVTLMTDRQVADVTDLARRAGISPTTTRVGPHHALLAELAPGERVFRDLPVGSGAGRRSVRNATAKPKSTARPTPAPRRTDAGAFSATSRAGARHEGR